jgi:glycosyltransferase involved in cell wall biosynthesis
LAALDDHELALICPGRGESPLYSEKTEWNPYRLGNGSRLSGLLQAAFDGRPLQEGLYDSAAGRQTVLRAIAAWRADVVVVQMVRCGWAIDALRGSAPETPVIFDAIDAMGLHFESAARSAPPPMAIVYRREAVRCALRESDLSHAATLTVAVSERDLVALDVPEGRGRAIPVAGKEVVRPASLAAEPVILLSGNLGYRPTVRGAQWFADEVWPRVRSSVPGVRWVLAGARPSAAVKRLDSLPGVEVHADVPDLGSYVTGSRVAIAPMSSGSGVPMKVLEAMAAGVPAIVHPWAADGLITEARDAVVRASDADGWVDALERLFKDEGAAEEIGRRGHKLWRRFYHPERVAEQIREVVEEAVG